MTFLLGYNLRSSIEWGGWTFGGEGIKIWWSGSLGYWGIIFQVGGGEGGGEDEQIFSSVGKTLNCCDGFF